MLLHWRRRGGATPLPSQSCQETTSCAEQAPASKICRERVLRSRPFPRLLQSEPVVQHKDGMTSEMRYRCPMSLCGDCDAPKYGKHPFVSRLLPPVLFRKRQPNKQGSEMQRHGWNPQSRSVPAYFPSHNNDACTVATQHATLTTAGGSSPPSRTGHTNEPLGSACTQATSAALRETERAPAAAVVPVDASSAKQGSILKVSRVVTAAASVAGSSHHVPEMQRSDGPAGIRDIQGTECRLFTQWHPPVAQRYLDATAAGCSAGHAQRNTKVLFSDRGFRGNKFPEVACGGLESGLYSAASSSVVCSTPLNQLRGHDGPPATVVATAKHTSASTVAAILGMSRGRQIGPQKDLQPVNELPNSVPHAHVEKIISPASARPAVEKNRALETENLFSAAHRMPQATSCFPCADKKSTPQKTETEKKPLSGANGASQQRRSGAPACFSTGDQAKVKVEETDSSSCTTCDKSPEPVAGVQQQIPVNTFSSRQNKSSKSSSEECSSAIDSHGKTKDALRVREQATAKEGSLRTRGWRSVPSASLGGNKVRTLWSVESLSDALVVRRGLATVLLIDGVGTAALLHRALSKHSDRQLQVQQNALSSSTDDEDVKLLDEMPAKVRSKSVILKILQGAVSLQQVLPVDVTQAQADLRLLSLQQLLVLRLKNYYEFETNSHYHSCHASFLRTLDCQIAELLGAFLVNEAFFDLFAPLVEQLQRTPASKRTCAAGVHQSLTCEERQSTSQAVSIPSFSGASTRCSSPQVMRNINAGREEAEVTTLRERNKAAEPPKHDVGCSEQPKCTSLNNNLADAAGDAGPDESVEGRKLRWGRVTWAKDLQRRYKPEASNVCLPMPLETLATKETTPRGSLSSSSVRNLFSKEATVAGIYRHAPGDIGKTGSCKCVFERQGLQEEPQQQQHQGHAAAIPKVGWHSNKKNAVDAAVGKQEYTEHVNSSAKAKKPHATLVEAQAQFLVERAAAKGLLSTYSPSSFDIPTGEAAATPAQLRALGAAFVRQLGLVVSAAAKGEVSSSGTNSNDISAADVGVLRRVQKHVLQKKNEQQEQEEVVIEEAANSHTIPQDDNQMYRKQCHMHEKGIAAGKWIKAQPIGSAASAAPAPAVTRPDGVWVRLLVPWKPCATKKTLESTKGGAKSCFPVVTTPSAATAASDCSHTATGADKGRKKEATAEEKRVADTAAAQNVVADAGRCSGPKSRSPMAAAARTNLTATIAAARVRRANTATHAETEVETPSAEEKSPQTEWMEAFLWLRFPTPRDRPTGNTAEAAADRRTNQKTTTMQQQQQRESQEGTTAQAGKSVFGRGVFEVVVSNDRPIGEALLWGLAPQNSKLLCKDSGPGCSNGISPTGKLAKWTVALLPETAVLQQHMGHDAQVNDVVSELKELLSRRCGTVKPPAQYQGGTVISATTVATR